MAESAYAQYRAQIPAPADHGFMNRALELAARGLYSTDPNPRVGCVIVREGNVVGEGWHRAAGGPHAEVEALREAGDAARNATVYVTLEPCSHHGRTPPCVHALIQAGVKRVVSAMTDPNHAVDGNGLALLTQAGIETALGLHEGLARDLNCGFVSRMERGKPWTRLKLATSLDGRTAMPNGDSHWISGPAARSDVHHWRARSSAILTGAGTVRQDNPRLNARPEEITLEHRAAHDEPIRQPLRAIVSSDATLIAASGSSTTLAMTEVDGPIVLLTPDLSRVGDSLGLAGIERVEVPLGRGGVGVDLRAVLDALARRECNEVFAECGATLAGNLLAQGLIDELLLYVAPCALGSDARPMAVLPGIGQMNERLQFELTDVRQIGTDARMTFIPTRP